MIKDFLRGFGSILCIFPQRKKEFKIEIPSHTDEEDIRKDWEAVSKDMTEAANNLANPSIVTNELLTPEAFFALSEADKLNIRSTRMVSPKLGDNHNGYIEVTYNFPVFRF